MSRHPILLPRSAGPAARALAATSLLASLGTATVHAQDIALEPVAWTGRTVPGGAGGLVSLSAPRLALGGHVVFRAAAISTAGGSGADTDGIWRVAPDGTVTLVARTNAPVPYSTTATINLASIQFGPAVDDAGHVAFGGRMFTGTGVTTSNRDALWITAPTFGDTLPSTPDLWLAARQSNTARVAPGASPGPATLSAFTTASLAPDGTLLYTATLAGTGYVGVGGSWALPRPTSAPASGAPRLVAIDAAAAPGGGGQIWSSVGTPSGSADEVAFSGTIAPDPASADSATAIWTGTPDASARLLAVTGAPAPRLDSDQVLHEFGKPVADDSGSVAWWGGIMDASMPEGIWLRRDGTHEPLALAGRPAPGLGDGWVFESFDDPVMAPGGQVAFLATARAADGTRRSGIWSGGSGAFLALVAAEGDPLPGLAQARLGPPGAPTLNRVGLVAFTAPWSDAADPELVAGDVVLARGFDGSLLVVARSGDTWSVPGRADAAVTGLRLAGLNEAGVIAVLATRADGSHVLARGSLPRPPMLDFAAWAGARGLAADSGLEDPDRDGIANLAEFALGLDPARPDDRTAAAQPRLLLVDTAGIGGEANRAAFSYERPIDAGGVVYHLQASTDLASWHGGAGFFTELDRRPVGAGRERVTVTDRLDRTAGTVFVRLLVER